MKTRANPKSGNLNRRKFIKTGSLAVGSIGIAVERLLEGLVPDAQGEVSPALTAADLPTGSAPLPVSLPHFPDRLHAFVWRNWPLVPTRRMAEVVGAKHGEIERIGKSMGLAGPPRITANQQRRSALTVIRRNWHLLNYDQLIQLLAWTPEQMAFTLREDDFLFTKLGMLKPKCAPLKYQPPDARTLEREREIARIIKAEFPEGPSQPGEPLFGFVEQLSRPLKAPLNRAHGKVSAFDPRFCFSYFALYGDPLLEPGIDPYPDGYLARLAALGVNGVWLQAILSRLAPFPWDPKQSRDSAVRLENLRGLVARARRHGIGIFLYLNEPRAWPLSFYATRPGLMGVKEGDYAALCTSVPEVRQYLVSAVASLCRNVPDLEGLFTITASENFTNCWSHHTGKDCPRCGKRPPAEVIAEVNSAFNDGIQQGGGRQKLIVWDWGWLDPWAEEVIARLPREATLMSVSEWSTPIRRGGVETEVGEYSISTVGPGPRAQRHWKFARRHGLKTIAKIQCANSWELSAAPYIPALGNVARHLANLGEAGVDGLMLGWTLGGYPSPNLELVSEMGAAQNARSPAAQTAALSRVAERRFGKTIAPAVVEAWQKYSEAFSEFPFHGGLVYNAPLQLGPANPLWGEPTGYRATMVGFPYDDLDGWRAVYPPEIFVRQFEKVADGFERAFTALAGAFDAGRHQLTRDQQTALTRELGVAETAAIHFRSTANQARFILARRGLHQAKSAAQFQAVREELERTLRAEIALARRLYTIQTRDSRIGFEASNQYYYVPIDLAEKVINCHNLLQRWLPAQKAGG